MKDDTTCFWAFLGALALTGGALIQGTEDDLGGAMREALSVLRKSDAGREAFRDFRESAFSDRCAALMGGLFHAQGYCIVQMEMGNRFRLNIMEPHARSLLGAVAPDQDLYLEAAKAFRRHLAKVVW